MMLARRKDILRRATANSPILRARRATRGAKLTPNEHPRVLIMVAIAWGNMHAIYALGGIDGSDGRHAGMFICCPFARCRGLQDS
jgi:hypothetical protein